ncbi:MAG: hypothetical protein BMS9Abin19_0982 [Gammaproteobacteria bacterium]|nr:MAG: hypothetical protein BMS9Abin19_0982 [Gammaproteobacteria bacterium]
MKYMKNKISVNYSSRQMQSGLKARLIARAKEKGKEVFELNGKQYWISIEETVYSDKHEDLTFDNCYLDQ